MYNIPAVLFAGGKSSRMGEDKALLPFKGHATLSEYQYDKLKKYFQKVYLSSKENKFDFDCKVIYDTQEIASPLVALVSLLETLPNTGVMVLSVDTPLVNHDIFKKLYEAYEESYDVIVAQSPNGMQALCGIYNPSILPLAKEMLAQNKHKLRNLLAQAKTKKVYFEKESLFTNLNYRHEYEAMINPD